MIRIGSKIVEGFEDIVFGEILPQDYNDITSVKNFIKWGEFYQKDYKWIRKRFQEFDYDSLSNEDKKIVAQRKGTTLDNCKIILGNEYEYWMTEFDIKSIECRQKRYSYSKTILIKNISVADQFNVLSLCGALSINYINYGIEGTSDGDPIDGLFNFIEATSGYSENGLLAMNLTMTNSVTKEQMVSSIMNCLRNGEY